MSKAGSTGYTCIAAAMAVVWMISRPSAIFLMCFFLRVGLLACWCCSLLCVAAAGTDSKKFTNVAGTWWQPIPNQEMISRVRTICPY